jgi:pyruvate-formate lyase-activating enzyme
MFSSILPSVGANNSTPFGRLVDRSREVWVRSQRIKRRRHSERTLTPDYYKDQASKWVSRGLGEIFADRDLDRNLLRNPDLRHARIETTNICNLDCIGCGTKRTKRKKSVIGIDLFEKAVLELKKMGVTGVGLYTIGEPLLSKNLGELIAIAQHHGMRTGFSTNGQYPERMDKIYQRFGTGRGLGGARFSVDAATEETYKKIRVGGDLNKIIESMRRIHNVNKQKKDLWVEITTKNMVVEDNVDEITEFFRVFDEWVYPEHHLFYLPNNMGLIEDFESTGMSYPNLVSPWPPCKIPATSLSVLADGGVNLCYIGRDFHGELTVGNIQDDDLSDIFHGKAATAVRAEHLEGESSLTASCCIGCERVYHFAKEVLCCFIQFQYRKNKDIQGQVLGERIRDLLHNMNSYADRKHVSKLATCIDQHFC